MTYEGQDRFASWQTHVKTLWTRLTASRRSHEYSWTGSTADELELCLGCGRCDHFTSRDSLLVLSLRTG